MLKVKNYEKSQGFLEKVNGTAHKSGQVTNYLADILRGRFILSGAFGNNFLKKMTLFFPWG
jgi:hypothetical protein